MTHWVLDFGYKISIKELLIPDTFIFNGVQLLVKELLIPEKLSFLTRDMYDML
jgi:hypothetical protein